MSNKTHILLVMGSFNIGGTEKHVLNLLSELRKLDYEISLVTFSNKGELKKEFKKLDIKFKNPFVTISFENFILKNFFNIFNFLFIFVKIFVFALKNKNSILHFFLPESYLIGGLAGTLANHKRMIMSRRSLNNYQNQKCDFIKFIEYKLHKKMSLILGNSEEVVRQLHEFENVPKQKLRLLYNGIDSNIFKKNKKTKPFFKTKHDKVFLTVLANLIPYKGHEDLLNSCMKLASKKWNLLIVGEDRKGFKRKLQKFVKFNKLTHKVKFLGYQSDIRPILEITDIGILPSHEEGFSNALLEYMSFSLPIIATNVGGNREVVIDGYNGIIVEPRNVNELTKGIDYLIKHKEKRKLFGKRSYKLVNSRFSLSKMVKKFK